MGEERNCNWIGEFYKSKDEESDSEKLAPKGPIRSKFSMDKDYNEDTAVCDSTSSLERGLTVLNNRVKPWTDIEEGEIIESVDAQAESKQQYSNGYPPGTKENIVDHKAVSHDLRKRKQMEDTTCRLCGKNFQSMKSLYGHMKCHTRNWRGVSPTTPTQSFSLIPAVADFNSSNQVLPSIKWPMTAKKGRNEKATTDPKYEEELEDPLMINAANNLLLLANGGFSPSSTPIRQQQNRNLSVPYDSRVTNDKVDLKISTQPDSMNMNSTLMDVDKTACSNQNIYRSAIDNINKAVDMLSSQSAINKPTKNINDLEIMTELVPNKKQYSCNICNKSFSSHQALGGHTTSHNKSKSCLGVGTLEGIKEAKLVQAEGLISQGGLPIQISEHRCNICSLTFPTGQALGGHKRKHWPGPAPAKKASHLHLDIDLNEPGQPEA